MVPSGQGTSTTSACGHVGQLGPVVLLGEDGHAEDQGVHAGEQFAARPEHPRDLGGEVLGHQLPGQGAVLGDDPVRAAVGEERQAARLGHHRGDPAAGSGGARRGPLARARRRPAGVAPNPGGPR